MSRQQLQDSEAVPVPDKAMLATVLNYLKNKNLKETEEVLKKELSHLGGDDSVVTLHSLQASAAGQSGMEPMKYEESYTSKAPLTSTPSTNTTTTAYLQQQEDPTTALLYRSASKLTSLHHNNQQSPQRLFPNSVLEVESDEEDEDMDMSSISPVKRLSPLLPIDGAPYFSSSLASISNAISIAKAIGSSTPLSSSTARAAVAAAGTKTLDNKPIWLCNPLLPASTAASSLFTSCSPPNSSGPMILPGTSVTSSSICPTMMYQIMPSPTCMSRPLLTPMLTVLKSPPSLMSTPSMLLTNPLSAIGQNLALQSVIKSATQSEKFPSTPTTPVRVIAEPATGQVVHPHEYSTMNSTTPSLSPHYPRTLASIPPSELTPQHIELKAFAEEFKTRRIRLGFTQGSVGQSLAERGYNNFAQSTISRFEQMQLSPANAATIRVILEKWLLEAESPEPATITTNNVPQMAGRKRKKRAVFTPQTRSILEEFFNHNPRPNRQTIENISQKLDLLPEEVRVWFCNKRQKSKSGGSVHRASFDYESSLSTTSSGVPSPTLSDGGMSQKRRSPSPPKTPFTIEELSKSSIANTIPVTSPPAMSSLGIMASVTQSMSPLLSSGTTSQQVFSNPLLPAAFITSNQI